MDNEIINERKLERNIMDFVKKNKVNIYRLKNNLEESLNEFKLFSDDLLDLISQNQLNDENLFIFVARRGLFPSTVCADCGSLVKCNSCGAPTVLHKAVNENFFLCHRCGEHRSAMEKCNGWYNCYYRRDFSYHCR